MSEKDLLSIGFRLENPNECQPASQITKVHEPFEVFANYQDPNNAKANSICRFFERNNVGYTLE